MSYNLFIDDERYPHDITWMIGHNEIEWVIVRSYEEAMSYVLANGFPKLISFDHDLGNGPSGYDIAKSLIDLDLNEGSVNKFDYVVHSQNPVGRKNIEGLLESYKAFVRAYT
jgi:hypothetical protein